MRGLVVLGTLVLIGILALGARIFVVNPVREVLRARAAGSWPARPRPRPYLGLTTASVHRV